MTAYYPVFVYGTLRPGMSNHHWFGGKDARHTDAYISGYELVTNGSYPYLLAASDPDQRVYGTLVHVEEVHWDAVCAALDELEETDSERPVHDDNLYNRVLADVTTAAGEAVTAWVYIPPAHRQPDLRRRYPLVPGGQWRE